MGPVTTKGLAIQRDWRPLMTLPLERFHFRPPGTMSSACRSPAGGRTPSPAAPPDLEELYREHIAVTRARCRRLLGSEHAADDAAHETFLRVARGAQGDAHYADVRAWILSIATNYCLNELRAQRTRARYLGEVGSSASDGSADGSLLARDVLRKSLSRLPEEVLDAALLRYVHGHHDGEIARRVGVSRRTIVYRLAALRKSVESIQSALERTVHATTASAETAVRKAPHPA
jgi:RNA polymerase sigma-70 factor, ECF subfamily